MIQKEVLKILDQIQLDQIQQDNQDAKKCIEKSITTVCIEEGISF